MRGSVDVSSFDGFPDVFDVGAMTLDLAVSFFLGSGLMGSLGASMGSSSDQQARVVSHLHSLDGPLVDETSSKPSQNVGSSSRPARTSS